MKWLERDLSGAGERIPYERVTASLFPCHETIPVLAEILAAGGRSRRLEI